MSAVQRIVPEHQLLGRRVQPHVRLAPCHVGRQEQAQVARVVDPVPHELDVPRQVRLLGQLREVVHVSADRVRRQRLPLGLEDRVGVQQHDLVGGVHLGDRRQVGRLVVHCGEDPVSRLLEVLDPGSLHMRDVPVRGPGFMCSRSLVNRTLYSLPSSFKQPSVSSRIASDLPVFSPRTYRAASEPPHDLHDPGEGPVRP